MQSNTEKSNLIFNYSTNQMNNQPLARSSKMSPINQFNAVQIPFSGISNCRKESNVQSEQIDNSQRRTDVGLQSEYGNQPQFSSRNFNFSQFCHNKFGEPYKRVKLENGSDKIIDNQTCACKSLPKIPILKPNVLKGQSQCQSPERSEHVLKKMNKPL